MGGSNNTCRLLVAALTAGLVLGLAACAGTTPAVKRTPSAEPPAPTIADAGLLIARCRDVFSQDDRNNLLVLLDPQTGAERARQRTSHKVAYQDQDDFFDACEGGFRSRSGDNEPHGMLTSYSPDFQRLVANKELDNGTNAVGWVTAQDGTFVDVTASLRKGSFSSSTNKFDPAGFAPDGNFYFSRFEHDIERWYQVGAASTEPTTLKDAPDGALFVPSIHGKRHLYPAYKMGLRVPAGTNPMNDPYARDDVAPIDFGDYYCDRFIGWIDDDRFVCGTADPIVVDLSTAELVADEAHQFYRGATVTTLLPDNDRENSNFTISTDGRQVAFISRLGKTVSLYVGSSKPGSEPREILKGLEDEDSVEPLRWVAS